MHSLIHLSSSIAQIKPCGSVKLSLSPDDEVVYAASLDPHLNSISVWSIALTGQSHQAHHVAVLELPSLRDQTHSAALPPASVIDLKVLPESRQICLITSDGSISVCFIADQQTYMDRPPIPLDNIGTFEDGICDASWSPDDELLVIITNSDKLVVLTKSFDVLCENQIDYGRFGDDQPISLGWGQKATQFHGSLGKSAAQAPASPATADVTQSEEDFSYAYQISWRGDGAFFAITCPGRQSEQRQISRLIKVYSRTASLSSSSELIANSQLGDKIAWKLDGSIIASSVRDLEKNKLNIMFFERNGLQRYGFELKEIDSIVRIWGLAWNSDSSILAVGIEKSHKTSVPDGAHGSTYAVQLWTRNNYHWYFKHEAQADLCAKSASKFTPSMMWHPEQPQSIYLSLAEGFVEMRKFTWESLQDVTPKPDDTGSVAVIDGYQILLTPFRFQVVPPPMSSFQIPTQPRPGIDKPRIPTHVAFSSCSKLMCAICPDGHVSCYPWPISPGKLPRSTLARASPSSCFNLKLDSETYILCRQVTIMECAEIQEGAQNTVFVLVVLFSEVVGSNHHLRDGVHVQSLGKINPEDGTFDAICEGKSSRLHAPANEEWWKILTCGQDKHAYLQTSEGRVKKVSFGHSNSPTLLSIEPMPSRLPEFCPTFQCIKLTSSFTEDLNSTHVVGLTRFGKLYLSQELITTDCSSFTTDSDYLMYTTYSHELNFLELAELIRSKKLSPHSSDDLAPPQSSFPVDNISSSMTRSVERGSIIVTSVPSSMKIILQMPRGNLEVIHPRPMVLRTICLDYLRNEKWKEAFIECRKHKIDLNLLVDFDRNKFLQKEGISKFINQIDSNEYFCLFLSSLKVIDVTRELYPVTGKWKLGSTVKSNIIQDDGKINAVCDLMVDQLTEKQSHWGYINSLLTAMVCKKPPDYKSSLGLLTLLKSESPEKLADAVKYMIFLSDVNELYKFALSIYDLSLVVLIAQHSQKDPKEYLPFLQSLRDLEPNKLRFKIDDYLGNYSSGLKHLSLSLKDEEETNQLNSILKYTKLHHLYKEALEIYSHDLVITKALRNIQGDWLMETNKPFEAGLVFMLAGQVQKAVEGYKQAEAWQEMFSLIVQNSDQFDILEYAKDMASRLSGSGRFVEAASILLQFGSDLPSVISTLCAGQAFSQAILTVFSKADSNYSLITEIILPSAEEFSKSFSEEIDQLTEDLRKQVDRLEELESARETNPDLFFLGGGQKDEDNPLDGADAMTEATTIFRTDYSRYTQGVQKSNQSIVSSRTGRSSTKSSKMKKKEAKKKAIGKKGSIYEEEYLLNTLSKVCQQKLPELQNTIGSLLPALVQLSTFTKHQSSSTSFSNESKILEMVKNLQDKFGKFQEELSKQVEKIWDQRQEVEPRNDASFQFKNLSISSQNDISNNNNNNCSLPDQPTLVKNLIDFKVPRPVLPSDSLLSTWKLGFV